MKHKKVHLLLGGNLGKREENLKEAEKLIIERIGTLESKSSLYETAAWGKENQQAFLNQVLLIKTSLSAQEILTQTQTIESELGRIRFEKWGERLIDIDILFIDDTFLTEENLIIPHPFLHQRKFTLVPLNEISPYFNHPVLNKNIRTLLAECSDNLKVIKLS